MSSYRVTQIVSHENELVALTEDGKIWMRTYNPEGGYTWAEIPTPINQPAQPSWQRQLKGGFI